MYRFAIKLADGDCGEPRGSRRTSRVCRWPALGRLGVNSGKAVYCGVSTIRHLPIPHRATVVAAGPPQVRPPAKPCPPLEYLLYPQVRNQPNPLVSLAVQLANGQTNPPWPKQRAGRPPQGGVSAPRRVCVTHSHFWAKIVTPSPPPSTHRSPFFPSFHLRRTPG